MQRVVIIGANSAVAKQLAMQLDDSQIYCVTQTESSLQTVQALLGERFWQVNIIQLSRI